jgi:MYXO-CTERM domain-containing protein
MRPLRFSALISCSAAALVWGAGCAPADSSASAALEGGEAKRPLGSVASVVKRLRDESPALRRSYRFPIASDAGVHALVDAYDEEGGRWSMSGRAADSASSEFILKENEAGLYGWMVDRDRDLAWELTTEHGEVAVAEVPVTKIFPVCPVPDHDAHHAPSDDVTEPTPEEEPTVVFAAAPGFPGHVGTYPNNDVMKLQSRPGSQKVWYLNFTDTMNGSEPKSGHTKADVWTSWSITSAWLYSFDINVTTDPAVYAAAGATNSGCVTIVHAGIGDGSSCALNIFGTRRCCDNHLYRDGYATGRIADHESGHGLGLLHDGGSNGGEYFNGFSQFQWTPLMGNVWPGDRWAQGLFQMSKGEYTSATRTEDDFAIIDRVLDYVADDIPETKALVLDGTSVAAEKNWGQIARNTDTDSWSFEIGSSGGRATLKVDRIEHRGGSMLDVDASIVSSTGSTVVQNNAAVARHADLATDLPAGRYTLVVKGGGEGTPQQGFSNYSSIGLYAISGTLTGGVSTGGTGGTGGAGGMGGRGGMSGGGGSAGGTTGGAGSSSGGTGGLSGTAGMSPGGAGGDSTTAGAGGAGAVGGAAGPGGTPGTGGGTAAVGGGGATATGGSAGTPGASGSGTIPPGGSPSSDEESGCGCRVVGPGRGNSWALVALAGLAGAFVRRRRDARAASAS